MVGLAGDLNSLSRLSQLYVVIALLTALVYAAIFLAQGAPWLWIVVWILGFSMAAAAAHRPESGIAAYLVILYSTPRYEVLFNLLFDSHLLHVTTLFSVSGVTLWMLRNGRRLRLRSPQLRLGLALFAWFVLSALFATSEPLQATVSQTAQNPRHSSAFLFDAFMLLGIASQVMNDWTSSRWLILPLAIGLSIRVLWQGFEGLRLEGDIGPLLVMLLPLLMLIVQVDESRPVKMLMAAAAVGVLPAVAVTYNRGSVVALAVVVAFASWKYRRSVWILAAAAICVAAGAFWLTTSPYRGRFQEAWRELKGTEVGSVTERFDLWRSGFAIAIDHPILGVGPGHYVSVARRYSSKGHGLVAHNTFVQMAAETGFCGLGLFLALFGAAFATSPRAARGTPRDWTVATAAAVQISIAAYLTAGLFISRHDMVLAYVLVGWAASLGDGR